MGHKHNDTEKRSIGQQQMENVLKGLELNFVPEYQLGNYTFDLFIEKFNVLIEYHGTRWHYDKRFYEADHFDKIKDKYAFEKWLQDERKEKFAKENGYKVVVIWQHDWSKSKNRKRFFEKIFEGRK